MACTSRRNNISDCQTEEECVYETWMILQRKEVIDLEQALAEAKNGLKNEHELTQLIEKTVQNFQDYANNRSRLARINVSVLFAPTSCTTLEKSVLWIAGCRPSSLIHFGKKVGVLDDLTSKQMNMIDDLQAKTINEEKKVFSRLASLQEDIVDHQFASKIKNECENADEAIDEHSEYMAGVMKDADELRMKTLKEIVLIILKPLQAVEYLAAAKKMRLSFQKWSEKRDHQQRHTNKQD